MIIRIITFFILGILGVIFIIATFGEPMEMDNFWTYMLVSKTIALVCFLIIYFVLKNIEGIKK